MGENNPGLISYLSSFNFDCIFFFDEFEKQFNEGDCSILQIMDGVYNSEYRKIFLLTTNELSINQNLLSRPSRIRYVREFGNLEQEIVNEFLNDELKNLEYKEELMDYVDSLTISTIDILKAIVEEVNIHGIDTFIKFKNSFNVQNAYYVYNTIRGRIDECRVGDISYNIDTFIKEYTSYKNRYELEQQFNTEMKGLDEDSERAQSIREAYYEATKRNAYFDYESVYNQEKTWNKLRPGKDTFNEESVIKVDAEKKVVVTKYYNDLCFYYIENPNAKPSLYNKDSYQYKYVL